MSVYPDWPRPTPNAALTPLHERKGVCFHHTILSCPDSLARLLDANSQVSYHVIIDADGTRYTLVPDHQIAWHAGVSTFAGRSRCNDFLLGCAFVGDTYRVPLTEDQLGRQIAPGRKEDLNPVEWEKLIARIRERFAPASGLKPASL
jgi:N-acetyl-anhydromuramoyl-L-alanine amidase